MSNHNPVGTGNFSMNRLSGTIVGDYSHAEGYSTTASGDYSHAEGYFTEASGNRSHAEGNYTKALGDYSHAEGNYITASGEFQHAQGKFNIDDVDAKGKALNTYAHIVGNGTADARSNAHTLDWEGNAWYQGDVYVGSTSGTNKDDGSKKLATEEYVDSPKIEFILKSSTEGSTKQFKITIDDDGVLTATEIVESEA